MPNREMIHNVRSKLLLATATVTTAQTSASLDCRDYDSASLNIHYGATAPAPTSIVVEESDDDSTFTTAAAVDYIDDGGTHAVSTTRRIAYIGKKRYTRVVVTPNGSTILTITGMLGYAAKKPVANPI